MDIRTVPSDSGAAKRLVAHLPDISVLVAEDQETLREIYQVMLEKCGVTRVQFAENGLEAWRYLNASSFDILLTDMYMPELDGRGLVERIRLSQKAAIRRLPIILITGDESYRGCTSIDDYPISGCLTKPFHAQELRLALEHALSQLRDLTLGALSRAET